MRMLLEQLLHFIPGVLVWWSCVVELNLGTMPSLQVVRSLHLALW